MMRSAARWTFQHGILRRVAQRAAATGDLQARLMTQPALWRDPYPLHARLRAQGELVRGRLAFTTTSHRVAREVLGSPDFGVAVAPDLLPTRAARLRAWARADSPVHPVEPPSMLAVDAPEHTRYRRLVSKVFTARAVEGLRGQVQALADELLDELAAHPGPEVDLVARYAVRLPVAVIADVLGVPPHRRAEVLAFQHGIARSIDVALPWRDFRVVDGVLRGFEEWIGGHLADLRRAPGEDLLSGLVTVTDEEGGLTERELRATAGLIFAAGFETTVNLLGSGVHLLLEHPAQLGALRAGTASWADAVEEVLRVESPVQIVSRVAQRDTTAGGRAVRRGERVVVLLGAANRDPEVFADPERFDVHRAGAREHLAFSAGRHFCLGAALARTEGEIGLRSLFGRFPDVELAPGARRTPTRVLRGWEHLPVRLG
ncbi:cytochrome P450 [Kineococcus sp. NUM-3379]